MTKDGADVIERAIVLVDRAESKRRQARPCVKLRPEAFDRHVERFPRIAGRD
jgi:hypothetical protein